MEDASGILATLPRRLSDIALKWAAGHPDAPALFERGRVWTYSELAEAQAHIATLLAAHDVRPGDRVMLVSENCAAMVGSMLAIASLDAWAVLVNPRLSAREIDNIREHSGARRVLYMTHISAEAGAHAQRHGATALDLGVLGAVSISPCNRDCKPEPVSADPAEQIAALIYTTGTTGNPKGVMLTHRNLLFIAGVSGKLRGLNPRDRVYGVLPISHVYGLASVCLATLLAGACLHLEAHFTARAMAAALVGGGISVMQGVPAMYAKLLELLKAHGEAFTAPALRFIYAGGSPLDPALKVAVESASGLTLNNGYGLTEAAPTITQTRHDHPRSDCSVGTPLPGVEIRIVDKHGTDVAAGEAGELWARGPNVMKGYYRNAEATAQVIKPGGWLNTGDIARADADGALFIVGRTKEVIIRSGFNVYPVEVESVLNSHPQVTQSAVVGREVKGNEEVIAFVELAPGATVSAHELQKFAAEALTAYKRPAEIIVMPSLPAAANGKILKHRLKEIAKTGSAPQ
jgi:long-chain acyl-CoA synthetase